jgi:hypothetical protein
MPPYQSGKPDKMPTCISRGKKKLLDIVKKLLELEGVLEFI